MLVVQITAGKVTRYDPVDASITCEVMIPHGVTTPTCVALGGKGRLEREAQVLYGLHTQ